MAVRPQETPLGCRRSGLDSARLGWPRRAAQRPAARGGSRQAERPDAGTTRRGALASASPICEAAVGKTSLVRRYVLDQFDETYLTKFGTKVLKKDLRLVDPARDLVVEVNMAIWDIMGQEGFRELLKDAYFPGAHGILPVADLTRRETLDTLLEWIDAVDRASGIVPVVMALNKADLADQAGYDRAEARRITDSLHADCLLTSARTGENVEEAFRRLATRILNPGTS